MKFLKAIIIFIILLLIIFTGIKIIKSKQQTLENEPTAFIHQYKPLEESNSDKNSSKEEKDFETYTAKLQANENPQITTKISGYIKNIFVKENQRVSKGEKLLEIDSAEFDAIIQQIDYASQAMKLNIKALDKTLYSLKLDKKLAYETSLSNEKIYKVGGISKDKFELSKIAYEQKDAKYLSTIDQIEAKKLELKSQEALLLSKKNLKEYYTLYAPIDGIVENVILAQGDLTSSNKTILSMISKEQKLTFTFANNSIKAGQDVYMNNNKIGTISFISPSTQNYLQIANINLESVISKASNSIISIQVKIK